MKTSSTIISNNIESLVDRLLLGKRTADVGYFRASSGVR